MCKKYGTAEGVWWSERVERTKECCDCLWKGWLCPSWLWWWWWWGWRRPWQGRTMASTMQNWVRWMLWMALEIWAILSIVTNADIDYDQLVSDWFLQLEQVSRRCWWSANSFTWLNIWERLTFILGKPPPTKFGRFWGWPPFFGNYLAFFLSKKYPQKYIKDDMPIPESHVAPELFRISVIFHK